MEHAALPHGVSTFVSFDAPQRGADIPLGLQYWLDFFQGESEEAAYLLSRLDTPAARQMLLYHHTSPPSPAGVSDPLRAALLAELAALGDYPAQPRLVAVANGSGHGAEPGLRARARRSCAGSTAASSSTSRATSGRCPTATASQIFDGVIDLIWPLPDEAMAVTVAGTQPWDGAPGGSRASMAEMDAVPAPYGDIVALHPAHAFIPTISALDLAVTDPFHDIAGDPDLLSRTPFAAVYYPAENQEHVLITPESKAWFLAELAGPSTAVADQVVRGAAAGALGAAESRSIPGRRSPTPRRRPGRCGCGSSIPAVVSCGPSSTTPCRRPTSEVVWDGRDDRGPGRRLGRVRRGLETPAGGRRRGCRSCVDLARMCGFMRNWTKRPSPCAIMERGRVRTSSLREVIPCVESCLPCSSCWPPRAVAADVTVVNWNLLNFPGSTGATRAPYMRTVLAYTAPDLMVCEEVAGRRGARLLPEQRAERARAGRLGLGRLPRRLRHRPRALLSASACSRRSPTAGSPPRCATSTGGNCARSSRATSSACSPCTSRRRRASRRTAWRRPPSCATTSLTLPADLPVIVTGDFNLYTSTRTRVPAPAERRPGAAPRSAEPARQLARQRRLRRHPHPEHAHRVTSAAAPPAAWTTASTSCW